MIGALALWLLAAVLIGGIITAGALLSLRRQQMCPSCRIPLEPLASPAYARRDAERTEPSRTYEVLVCTSCTNAVTLVHGHRSRFAYCPACLQRALRTPCMRLDDADERPVVVVHEHCEICGYRAERRLGEVADAPTKPRGTVILFPSGRDPSTSGEDEDPKGIPEQT